MPEPNGVSGPTGSGGRAAVRAGPIEDKFLENFPDDVDKFGVIGGDAARGGEFRGLSFRPMEIPFSPTVGKKRKLGAFPFVERLEGAPF